MEQKRLLSLLFLSFSFVVFSIIFSYSLEVNMSAYLADFSCVISVLGIIFCINEKGKGR